MNTFVDLNISRRLLNKNVVTVLNAAHDLVLESNETYGSILLEGRRIACVTFNPEQDFLHEAEVWKAYSDSSMIVDESDSNFDISFLVSGGVFNYVFEKVAFDDTLCFYLNKKKFTLSKKHSLIVE